MLKNPSVNRLLAAILIVASVPAAEPPATAMAMTLAREATAAADEKDLATYLAKMEQAVALRPDFPRMLVNLAAAQAANQKPEDAVATLERLAALGLNSPVDKSPDFAVLRERKDFQAVVKKIAGNMVAKGEGRIAFSLPGITGLIEGIAWREKTGEFYFGDVNGRAVWIRNADGTLRRFTPEGDDLLGVFALAVDEARGALWAATSAVAAMRGFESSMDGTAALAEIDLESGTIRQVIPVQGGGRDSHVLGDLALAPDGTIYLPDSGAAVIWRLSPGATALEPLVQSEEFMSLQGVVVLPSGNTLIVADHANGLLAVDLGARPSVRRLDSPPNTTLIGLDGLARAGNGDVVAIQNGVRPNRVLRVTLSDGAEQVSDVKILESAHLNMPAPSLGCIATDGQFFYVGNAGWTRFEGTDGAPTSPRLVPIFRTKL
jgi:sugar lactone lactonase YvrE